MPPGPAALYLFESIILEPMLIQILLPQTVILRLQMYVIPGIVLYKTTLAIVHNRIHIQIEKLYSISICSYGTILVIDIVIVHNIVACWIHACSPS